MSVVHVDLTREVPGESTDDLDTIAGTDRDLSWCSDISICH